MDSTFVKDIKDILAILTPVALALIAYFQFKAGQKQKEIGLKVDGMTSKLVEAEKGKSSAEGELKGLAAAEAKLVIPADVKVSLKEEVVQKVAETVVETVKSDPAIEIKKVD